MLLSRFLASPEDVRSEQGLHKPFNKTTICPTQGHDNSFVQKTALPIPVVPAAAQWRNLGHKQSLEESAQKSKSRCPAK